MKNWTSIGKFTTLFPTLNKKKILLFPHENYFISAPIQKTETSDKQKVSAYQE